MTPSAAIAVVRRKLESKAPPKSTDGGDGGGSVENHDIVGVGVADRGVPPEFAQLVGVGDRVAEL